MEVGVEWWVTQTTFIKDTDINAPCETNCHLSSYKLHHIMCLNLTKAI